MYNAYKETYSDTYNFCPMNTCSNCPYHDKLGICHISDPIENDDWDIFFEDYED